MPSKQDVASFIGAAFRSVWALELLVLLRQNRDRSLGHAEMVDGLRASDLVVTQSVEALSAAGLVVVEEGGAAQFKPASKDVERLVEATIAEYGKSPDAIRRIIVAAANPGITAFADAFRLRKD